MSVSIPDLKYALNPVLPTIDDAYLRYAGTGNIDIPGINHLGVITADTRRARVFSREDPKLARILRKLLSTSNILGVAKLTADGQTGFISFRGTEKESEWLDDFDFAAVAFNTALGKAKVHKGFWGIYQLALDSVNAYVPQLAKAKRIIVSGHSLGAGVATLCALDFKARKIAGNVSCWTYASPRIFFLHSAVFDKHIDSSIRVQNPVDVVTHVPLVFQGFRHVKGGILLKPKIEEFHSLDETYMPGLVQYIKDHTPRSLKPAPSEETAINKGMTVTLPVKKQRRKISGRRPVS